MPTRPLTHRPTSQPDKATRQQRIDVVRGTRTQRGYDNDWLRYSKNRLARFPWCERCLAEGNNAGKKALATVTDHVIPPSSNPARYWELFRDPTNHQSLCKTCHDRKTVAEDGGFGHRKDCVREPLYVVCAIFNPVRFKRRWKLFRDFQRHIRESGAILLTIEAAFGERDHALEQHAPTPDDPEGEPQYRSAGPANVPHAARLPHQRLAQDYIKVRVHHQQEIWLKENLQNIAVQHLPPEAKYIAFIDADVQFTRPDWVSETIHALQHFKVVQMFSICINLSAAYEPMEANYGFSYCHNRGVPRGHHHHGGSGGQHHPGHPNAWHTGFAWAWRRDALDNVGGLIEHAILGAGDNHMARCLIGRGEESINKKLSCSYRDRVMQWERRALEHINYNVGYIDGTIFHAYHGRIINRRYSDRWKILINHHFDPDCDLKKDWRGVIALTSKKPALRDDIRRYFRARQEDSIDVYASDEHLLGPSPAAW